MLAASGAAIAVSGTAVAVLATAIAVSATAVAAVGTANVRLVFHALAQVISLLFCTLCYCFFLKQALLQCLAHLGTLRIRWQAALCCDVVHADFAAVVQAHVCFL